MGRRFKLGEGFVVLDADGTEMGKVLDAGEDRLEKFAKTAKRLAVAAFGAFAVKKLFDFATGAVEAATDINEAISKNRVLLGQSADDVEAWSKTTADAFGISRREALIAVGDFAQLFVAMGIGQESAALMSTEMVELAGDIASFSNLRPEIVLQKLRSGLVGEVEPLRTLGISFNEAQVQQKAFQLGIAELGDELSVATKLQARYALILEQSAKAQGDAGRTGDELAGRIRRLRARFEDFRAELGQKLLPIAEKLFETFFENQGTIEDLADTVKDMAEAFVEIGVPAINTFIGVLIELIKFANNARGELSAVAGVLGLFVPKKKDTRPGAAFGRSAATPIGRRAAGAGRREKETEDLIEAAQQQVSETASKQIQEDKKLSEAASSIFVKQQRSQKTLEKLEKKRAAERKKTEDQIGKAQGDVQKSAADFAAEEIERILDREQLIIDARRAEVASRLREERRQKKPSPQEKVLANSFSGITDAFRMLSTTGTEVEQKQLNVQKEMSATLKKLDTRLLELVIDQKAILSVTELIPEPNDPFIN